MRRLLINFARIGDLVMLTPMLRLLRRDGEVHLLCRPWGRDLLADQDLCAGIHSLAHPNHQGLSELLRGRPRERLGRELGELGFDEVVLFEGERPVITQWIERWFPGIPHRTLRPPGGAYVPETYGPALAAAGYDTGTYEAIPRLTVAPAAREAATRRLAALGRRVVLIQAGSSSTHRLWRSRPNLRSLAPAQWAELIDGLLDGGACDAVGLLGSPLERRDAAGIAALVGAGNRARVHNLAGQAPIREQPALAAAALGLISVDTGPAHIAAAVGCPLLMVFGPSIPEIWCPRGDGPIERVIGPADCGPCQGTPRMGACRANQCLTRLPRQVLLDGWQRLMARRG